MLDKGSIGKGAVFLYVEAINLMFSSYIFWLILTQVASPAVIGSSSTIIALASIFMVVASVGIPGGIQKYLGKNLSENNIANIKGHINTSLLFTILGIIGTTVVILILKDWIYEVFKIQYDLLIIMILIVGFSSFSGLLRSIIIPTLKIKIITVTSVIATSVKILVAFILVWIGTDVLGILIGYLLYPLVSSIIFSISIRNTVYRQLFEKKLINVFLSLKEIFVVSLSFWIPNVINVIGSQLGTVSVFLSSGSTNAGVYFIAFSICTGITLVVSVLSTIAYPMVSAMKDGRKNAVWRLIKISLIITVPISISIIFYAPNVLQIFGHDYALGSENLIILLLSIVPTSILSGIGVLVYAYGHNTQFMLIGLFTSVPRVILYFILVPLFGGNGAAITYLIGSVAGFILSLYVAKRTRLKLFWKQILLVLAIPLLFSASTKYLNIDFVLGISITIIASYLLFLKLRLLNDEDVRDIINLLPPKVSHLMVRIFRKFYKRSN
jgi:O-antigen/teichoic acid export membrane protein